MKGMAILVVDDNAYMRTIIATIARVAGATIIEEASNGADAFGHLRARKFDCATVDLNMDPINGLEFIRLLRTSKDSPDPALAVIVISAYAERARILEARDAGADEFLAKPVTASAFMSRLQAVIHARRPFVTGPTFAGPDRRRRTLTGYAGPFRRKSDRNILDVD